MDFNNDYYGGERWAWQGEDYCLQKNPNCDISECSLNEVTLNEEDASYMFDDTTPVKACGNLEYHVTDDVMNKKPKECRETSSQLKRRRMLQFDTQRVDSPFFTEDMSSGFLKSNEGEDSLKEIFSQASQWAPGLSAHGSASSYDGLDQSSEGWITECFNDTEMNFGSDDMNFPGASDFQIDISDFCNVQPEFEANVVQKTIARTPNIVFKGRKSFIQTPTKLASSVAYPFAFIKPCGVHGDVTLKDINQRICTPSSTPKQTDDPATYPTSAFSGKPVVGKTKIRTEGGKGSITIMRTKG